MSSRVLIGIIANDAARFSLFTACALQLRAPLGSHVQTLIGGDWCAARNELARMCVDQVVDADGNVFEDVDELVAVRGEDADFEYRFTHLFFMDDDHAFPPSIAERLLARDVPLVTPVCLTRVYPFTNVSFVENPDEDAKGRYLPISLSETPTDGLVEIVAGGCAGMMIHRDVLEATRGEDTPWFEYGERSEDILFCEKAREAGFPLYTDLEVTLGHITTAVVSPFRDPQGRWLTQFTIGRDYNLFVEPAEVLLAEQLAEQERRANATWRWTVKRVLTDEVVWSGMRPPMEPVDWKPEGDLPLGLLQFWLDEGDGLPEHTVGDPFYAEEVYG